MIRVLPEFLDPWPLQAATYRLRDEMKKGDDGVHVLPLVDGAWNRPELERWGSIKRTIIRARKIAGRAELNLLRADLESLDPQAEIPWQMAETVTVRIGITWHPADFIFYAPMAHTVLPGQVVLIPPGRWSAMNLGAIPRLQLVLLFERETVPDA